MKAIIKISILIILFIVSCTNSFNPKYFYYNKNKNIQTENGSSEDLDNTEYVDPAKDPFKNGEWNNINYGFDGSKIPSWFLKVSFGDGNVPSYGFFNPNDGRRWIDGDLSKNEKYFDGSKDGNRVTSPLSVAIDPLKIYRYDYKNPLVTPNSSYNLSERMKRFLFIRIDGEAVIKLDQYLIAIDTYSKFIFAYAKITETGKAPVVGTPYPTKFEPIEKYVDKRPFYEYDPIGFVQSDGTIILYQEYKDEMRKGATDYVPSIHRVSSKVRDMAKHNVNNPGRSPYLLLEDEENFATLIVKSKSIKNIDIKSQTYSIFGRPTTKNEAYLVYATRTATYQDGDSKEYKMLANYRRGEELGFGATGSSIITIKNGETIENIVEHRYTIKDLKSTVFYIDIDTQFIKYNWRLGFPDYRGTVTKLSTYDNSLATFKYDPSTSTLSIKTKKDKIKNIDSESIIIKKGETKNIKISYTNNNENWEVEYTITIE